MELIQQSQLKLNLSLPMKQYVENRADKFGMTIAAYIKHLIAKDIEDRDYPIFKPSLMVESASKKAVATKKKSVILNGTLEQYFAKSK